MAVETTVNMFYLLVVPYQAAFDSLVAGQALPATYVVGYFADALMALCCATRIGRVLCGICSGSSRHSSAKRGLVRPKSLGNVTTIRTTTSFRKSRAPASSKRLGKSVHVAPTKLLWLLARLVVVLPWELPLWWAASDFLPHTCPHSAPLQQRVQRQLLHFPR